MTAGPRQDQLNGARCLHKDWGIGRLATLGELIKGVKPASGNIIGLSVNPVKDSNYSYDIVIIGQDLLIRAISRVEDLGSLGTRSTPCSGGAPQARRRRASRILRLQDSRSFASGSSIHTSFPSASIPR